MIDEESLEIEKAIFKGLPLPRERDGRYGYIDHDGNEVIPFIYDDADHFYQELACVRLGSKVGFINTDGKFVIPFIYDDAKCFYNGFCVVRFGNKWGVIDTMGDTVVEAEYDYIDGFYEQYGQMVAKVVQDGYMGKINLYGEILSPFR
jgi:hypothetical protein